MAFLQEWSAKAPWPDSRQVEQDLIISRALCDLFNANALKDKIAFRGGTALHKLLFARPLRYSEDIDLVQLKAEPNGPIIDAIREALSWLGPCKRERADHSARLTFRFAPEADSTRQLKLKVELNTREHECFLGGWPAQPKSQDHRSSNPHAKRTTRILAPHSSRILRQAQDRSMNGPPERFL
jgi:hypothetical protein